MYKNSNNLLKTMDILIISVIVIQFVIFLLNYETALVVTLFAGLQFMALITYFIYIVKMRAGFETIVNQENKFFKQQFKEIKYNYDHLSYDVTEYFDRQRDITNIRNMFKNSRMIYRKRFSLDHQQTLGFDLILITNKGIFIFDFYEAAFVLKGDYQKDIIKIQYSKNNELEVFNPLSKLHPVYKTLKETLKIEDEDMIKRMLILNDASLVTGLETLDKNQGITKNADLKIKIRTLMDQSMINLTLEEIEDYHEILDEKIAG
ncbi:MAG: hypothetical protein ACOC2U_02990 [bacterium]